jgi:CRISPR/Cas system-associated protein Cas10 (large subunit of type III CRISPR-Cas system)
VENELQLLVRIRVTHNYIVTVARFSDSNITWVKERLLPRVNEDSNNVAKNYLKEIHVYAVTL